MAEQPLAVQRPGTLSIWWGEDATPTTDAESPSAAAMPGGLLAGYQGKSQIFNLNGPQDALEDRYSSQGSCAGRVTQCGPNGWAENATVCSVCDAALGKRRLRPRHHCRICCRSVCARCSSSTVQLEGHQTPQRACSLCVRQVSRAPSTLSRLELLGSRLSALSGAQLAHGSRNLEDALVLCEAAVQSLEESARKSGTTSRDEAAARQAGLEPQVDGHLPATLLERSSSCGAAANFAAAGQYPEKVLPPAHRDL